MPVAADGMPSYHMGEEDPELVFGSLFESRQLARVDLVNDTHERISLFLSVYSLDPGKNLSILVPLRTLPADVSGGPMKESDFRGTFLLDRAEEEVVRQDPDVAWSGLREEFAGSLQGCFGSMLLTLPGEYIRDKVHFVLDDTYRGKDTSESGGEYVVDQGPEPVQHYEFDGFSIDVFSVDAGPQLSQYLQEKGLVLPEGGQLERYNAHYLAVVEGATKPPIDEEDFALLQQYAPNTTRELADELISNPERSEYEVWDLKYYMEYPLEKEVRGIVSNDDTYWYRYRDVRDVFYELVDAVFGATDFEGEVLTIDLPLDSGRVFFPLGTSAGWPNEIGDIDVLFRVPEDRDLALTSSRDAYFGGSHWYLFQMSGANPDFDLESTVSAGDESHRKAAERAAFLNDNATSLGGLLAALVVLMAWFGTALAVRRWRGLEGKTIRDPLMWMMLGGSLVLSIPGALLAYLMIYPLPARVLLDRNLPVGTLASYPVACVLFVVGVLL